MSYIYKTKAKNHSKVVVVKVKPPKTDKVDGELEKLGYVSLGEKRYLQNDKNCFEISSYLAKKFGYWHPESRMQLHEIIHAHNSRRSLGGDILPTEKPTEACLVIRKPDYLRGFLGDIHVSFELLGREFNYGPGTKDGFDTLTRIYLGKPKS